MKLTGDEKALVQAFRSGQGILCNADLGHCIETRRLENGRISICVDLHPLVSRQTCAQNKFMWDAARTWTHILCETTGTAPKDRGNGGEHG